MTVLTIPVNVKLPNSLYSTLCVASAITSDVCVAFANARRAVGCSHTVVLLMYIACPSNIVSPETFFARTVNSCPT